MFSWHEPQSQSVLEAAIGGIGIPVTRVFFVTNRNELKNGEAIVGFGSDPHQKGPHWLRVGHANVELTADEPRTRPFAEDEDINLTDLVVYPEAIQDSPEHHYLGSNRLFADLMRILRDEQKDLILYVHGYDTSFKEALWSAARIRLRYNRVLEDLLDDEASAPFLARRPRGFETLAVSWPSDGRRLDHWGDRHAALQSSRALGRALLKARDFVQRGDRKAKTDGLGRAASRAEGRIHVLVEGKGSVELNSGFEDFHADPSIAGGLPKLFGQLFKTRADEDASRDCFRHFHACANDIVVRDMVLSICGADGEHRAHTGHFKLVR